MEKFETITEYKIHLGRVKAKESVMPMQIQDKFCFYCGKKQDENGKKYTVRNEYGAVFHSTLLWVCNDCIDEKKLQR
jgi:hypothetical protein